MVMVMVMDGDGVGRRRTVSQCAGAAAESRGGSDSVYSGRNTRRRDYRDYCVERQINYCLKHKIIAE